MSKTSQRKKSMTALGKKDFKYLFPRYPESKEYMKGYNSMKPRSVKMKIGTSIIFFTIAMMIIIIPSLTFGGV